MNHPTCFSLSWTDPEVAHLALNRPEALNTMGPAFWRELDALLQEINAEGRARALVISSTGKHFSAGMALETFGGAITMDDQSPEGRAAIFDLLSQMQATFTRLETLRMPVVFAIQGGCVGGAVDLVTAGCIRYASADAFFCIQEINIGMAADVGTLQRLPKLIPLGVVKELAYTGRRLPAARAQALGLVNEVFDSHAATVEAALQCAREIAAKPPVAIWGSKQALNYARDHSVDDSLRQMGWLQGAIWSNAHVREAIVSAKERRAGRFTPLTPLKSFLDAE
ncbi:MAG: enoyl-CoA hydratase [Hydrogenophaga sp.]|uniref:enoyl-CoA hydratase-related protein n=1 Tax=Hydrogenophaga sp. TaxID=1904254 RepID=UPI0016AB5CA0|nr:enoyl-CoA hydratase-related protein [Hydrogenophaga sp.]NIM42752.1 enoyl-CoA hydratase [Hydrogenophaga sp.]NIN25795.1 enoyl-CoA hydratase [Hydrogenophaga sp.]NIN30457.1 enoyl-CoA hydratase [Hydrogenophaga sp.]NIN56797.1 enoyl-CoA hydratase [Hydrogenophaga sp.]NIO53372.1 enoyl-CoA hydratase [Hydrogenophaga sp.]